MSPAHHPSDAILAAYAAGALADGPSLVTAAHLERCDQCRGAVGLFEAVGGALLAELPPADMQADALALALARIDRSASPPSPGRQRRRGPEGVVLPKALARRSIGQPQVLAPGVWIARVSCENTDGWRTCLARTPPGYQAPHHGHDGPEYLVVLQGGFADERAAFRLGDFVESDADYTHHPITENAAPCICLISSPVGMRAEELRRLFQSQADHAG